MSPNAVKVIQGAQELPLSEKFGPWTWSVLARSQPDSDHPLVVGFWKSADYGSSPSEPLPDPETTTNDEVKYVVKGLLEIEDCHSGNILVARPGDVIWIPKGARSRPIRSEGVEAFYAELSDPIQCETAVDFPPTPGSCASALQDWHNELLEQFISTNPKSKSLHDRASKVMPGGNTRAVLHSTPFPLAFHAAKGINLRSVDSHEYLDFVSEYSAAMFGHSHPDIQAAIHQTADDGFNFGGPSPYETELAEQVCLRFKSVQRVRFCNSGSEANIMALAAALTYTKRKKVVVFEHGYHGGQLSFHTLPNPINIPHEFVVGKYNDIEQLSTLISSQVAAVLVEPILGAGGVIPATRDFLESLRQKASAVGAVLIFDEVMSSRLAIGGLQGYWGVYPDMTTLGKYIGGGFSFGAFGGRADIMSIFDPTMPGYSSHSGTFNQNAFSMRAGLAGTKILTTAAIAKANSLGDRIRNEVRAVLLKHPTVPLDVSGFGSMVGLHWSSAQADILRDTFFRFLLARRIYIGQRGFIALNICHNDEHIELLLEAIAVFLAEVADLQTHF